MHGARPPYPCKTPSLSLLGNNNNNDNDNESERRRNTHIKTSEPLDVFEFSRYNSEKVDVLQALTERSVTWLTPALG